MGVGGAVDVKVVVAVGLGPGVGVWEGPTVGVAVDKGTVYWITSLGRLEAEPESEDL